MKIFKYEISKKQLLRSLKNAFFVLLGCFILELGTGVFIIPMNIVCGGLSGIAIILDNTIPGYQGFVDVTVAILTVAFMLVSLLFLGKKFTLSTVLATVFSPLFLSLVYRVEFFQTISSSLVNSYTQNGDLISYLLCVIFGGLLIGAGVAIAFMFGGSTGGLDVLTMLTKKYIKKSNVAFVTFVLDGAIIIASIIVFWKQDGTYVSTSLMNILCCLLSSLTVEMIYGNRSKNLICDIISEKATEINNFIQHDLSRGSTIILGKGGYTGKDRKIIRVIISSPEYNEFYTKIHEFDPDAFVSFSVAHHVAGYGFSFQEGDESLLEMIIRKKKERKEKTSLEQK